jgi:hypothetical protein
MSAPNPFLTRLERAPREIADLLEKLPANFIESKLEAEQLQMLEATGKHAANYSYTLVHGFEAVGQLLFAASTNEQLELKRDVVSNTASLLSMLAVQAQYLQELQDTIRYTLDHQGESK